ncbi:hypothetical protein ABEO46_07720 [Geobacillus stearothermophilus]|uniref:hypothetical protein n=1 Tax=Geobacillus stearothermophilus TaxID=1422 RepID=UPI003D23C09E
MDIQLPMLQSVMPKAPEAASKHALAQQHPHVVQAQRAAAEEKRAEQERRQVTGKRAGDALRFGSHPYKGKTIDIKG